MALVIWYVAFSLRTLQDLIFREALVAGCNMATAPEGVCLDVQHQLPVPRLQMPLL